MHDKEESCLRCIGFLPGRKWDSFLKSNNGILWLAPDDREFWFVGIATIAFCLDARDRGDHQYASVGLRHPDKISIGERNQRLTPGGDAIPSPTP